MICSNFIDLGIVVILNQNRSIWMF